MRNYLPRVAAILIVTLVVAGTSGAQDVPNPRILPNFHKVNEHLYRGAQPGQDGLKKLAELGVKTVINLRDEEDLSQQERREAGKAGLQYFCIPMAGLGRPTDAQLSRVMLIIDSSENWPVFVHCKRGSDRTGTVIACYHILHDGWKSDRAITEARQYGMSWIEFGMRDYVSHYQPAPGGVGATKETKTAMAVQSQTKAPQSTQAGAIQQ